MDCICLYYTLALPSIPQLIKETNLHGKINRVILLTKIKMIRKNNTTGRKKAKKAKKNMLFIHKCSDMKMMNCSIVVCRFVLSFFFLRII